MSDLLLYIIIALVVINIVVMLAYGWDKRKAVNGDWRTPEKTLLLGALIAPWGAILGMHVFHHKTQKTKFKLVYLFALLHIVIIILMIIYKPL